MSLLTIQKLGRNRDTPRLWIESQRLEPLGFSHGVPLQIETRPQGLVLRPAILGENHVSSRQVPGGRRPIIDLENQSMLSGLTDFSELKIIASFERIEVTPSRRAFAIQKSRMLQPPFRVLELFAGGGTMTAALESNPVFQVVAGVEIEPDFADEWQTTNPAAQLIQADIQSLHTSELPSFDVLLAGIPCTSHSNLGRAKKGLAGKPEFGDSGGLFLPVLSIVAERMPAAVVLENVPGFATSLAGELVVSNLKRIGYHVFTTVLQPNTEWGEIEDRKRWLLIGTLDRPFSLSHPASACVTPLAAYLDPPDDVRDRVDAQRIARTIEGLRAHNARHQDLGHGFSFSVVQPDATRIPTIPKSYHKINTGPFVHTDHGLRLLRQTEVERIHGVTLATRHYATALQILGQGVQTRVFRGVFRQLANYFLPESPW
jgi:DNA (cytosine-5)-methyltransferase 1